MKLTQSEYDFDRPIPGRSHREPFRIFGFALARALGDFLVQNVVLASMKCAFEHSSLFIYSRIDRPYKQLILESNTHITKSINFHNKDSVFPGELFDINSGREIRIQDDDFYRMGANHPDFVATPSMLHLVTLLGLSNIAGLSFPEERTPSLGATLESMGIDTNRWFCTLHYREPNYENRPASVLRDNDPDQFLDLRDFVIDELGGQVVRIGHRAMKPFPAREGFVDLAKIDGSFELQTFAITRSRFLLGGSSGPTHLGCAYKVPTAYLQAIDESGAWNQDDFILMQRIYDPSGRRVGINEALPTGLLREMTLRTLAADQGFRILPNTVEELRAAARAIYKHTNGVDGWRDPVSTSFENYPNRLALPVTSDFGPSDSRATYLEYPES
ncbi:MAG: TIGR04372 family glycosyltransferase [Rhodospirillaceae bacterium]|jgi:putative glycosyltransferase (TIGR04372 family)|nr:TIGR04372 family glycosyltransferase [Rhodospirillaceae bacterium]